MTGASHLWAIGYEDVARADRVRDEIVQLGWGENSLVLDDVAVVVRHPDGSFTLNREAFPAASNIAGCSAVGLLAGLVLGVPMVGVAIGAIVGSVGSVVGLTSAEIDEEFVSGAQALMKPGT